MTAAATKHVRSMSDDAIDVLTNRPDSAILGVGQLRLGSFFSPKDEEGEETRAGGWTEPSWV